MNIDVKARTYISSAEGKTQLLFSDTANPYESIYIRASILHGVLTVTDSECEHGPDGGWSHRIIEFDKENTEKVISFLLSRDSDALRALSRMLSNNDRTNPFRSACNERGIQYETRFSF